MAVYGIPMVSHRRPRTRCAVCGLPVSPTDTRYRISRIEGGRPNSVVGVNWSWFCERCYEGLAQAFPLVAGMV